MALQQCWSASLGEELLAVRDQMEAARSDSSRHTVDKSLGDCHSSDIPAGIQKEIVKEAAPADTEKPQKGDEVTVHYVGMLESDGSVFDSSRSRGKPFSFTVGIGQVIKGWDHGVISMRKGEIARLTMHSYFGCGEQGQPPRIPGNATLIFEIELLGWVGKNDLFKDGSIIKEVLQEGPGWEVVRNRQEVRMSLKALAANGTVIEERRSFEYAHGSDLLGERLGRVIDKVLTTMKRAEKCQLICREGCAYAKDHGQVKLEIVLEEMFRTTDVSLMKDKSVMKKLLRKGEGSEIATDGAVVSLRVEAVTDGEKALASVAVPVDIRFSCSDGEVCDALEAAVCSMKKGELAMVTCNVPGKCTDPSLGITKESLIGLTKIVFFVDLMDFERAKDAGRLSDEEKIALNIQRKEIGSKLFSAKRYELALEKYKKVNDGICHIQAEDQKELASNLRRTAELNKAACYLQLGRWNQAIFACNLVLKEDRFNVKALFRRAKAKRGLEQISEAMQDVERILEEESNNADAKALLRELKSEQKAIDKQSQATYAKMCQGFGKLGRTEKENRQSAQMQDSQQESKFEPDSVTDDEDTILQDLED